MWNSIDIKKLDSQAKDDILEEILEITTDNKNQYMSDIGYNIFNYLMSKGYIFKDE